MERLPMETRVLVVNTHYKYGECFANTHQKLRTLGFHNAPNVTMIRWIIDRFEKSGTVEIGKSPGRPWREDATIAVVRDCHGEP